MAKKKQDIKFTKNEIESLENLRENFNKITKFIRNLEVQEYKLNKH